YFKVTAIAKLTVLWSEDADVGAAVAISATPGPQYRMGDIRIVSTDSGYPLVISPEVLRGLIPLQRGELFSVEKVRSGLQNLALVYGREGYVDMTQVDGLAVFLNLSVRLWSQNLALVYGREGYVDMTPEPDTEVEEDRKTVDLVVKIDQQVPY